MGRQREGRVDEGEKAGQEELRVRGFEGGDVEETEGEHRDTGL